MFQKNLNKSDDKQSVKSSDASASRKIPPTIISIDVRLLGNVISEGVVDIDGRIEGNVKSNVVYLRENGVIVGDLVAETVHVFGAVHGVVKARKVSIYPTAHIEGTIMHQSLGIEDGAYIDAQFKPFDSQPRITNDQGEEEDLDLLKDLKLIS